MQGLDTLARRTPNYGLRAKFGMMLPSSNSIAEPQIAAMLPEGVSLHVTRLQLRGGNGEEHLKMLERIEEATSLLLDADVDRIMFHCTAVSMFSPEIPGEIRRRIGEMTQTPITITSEAVIEALRMLGATKIVLLSPYVQETNDREVHFLRYNGIDVLRERGLGIDNGVGMAAVTPEQWYDEAIAMRDTNADAYFLSCTTIRSADVIEPLERELGRPVLTSNQVALWQALRDTDIEDHISGYGQLLSR